MVQHGWIFENITLSERSQSQKATYCMFLFIWNVRISKHMQIKSRLGLSGLKDKGGRAIANEYAASSGMMKCSQTDGADSCTHSMERVNTTELYTLSGWHACNMNYISIKLLYKTCLRGSHLKALYKSSPWSVLATVKRFQWAHERGKWETCKIPTRTTTKTAMLQ